MRGGLSPHRDPGFALIGHLDVMAGKGHISRPSLGAQRAREPLPPAEQTRRDRRLANAQRARRLTVGEANDVDGDQGGAKIRRQRSDGGESLVLLRRRPGRARDDCMSELASAGSSVGLRRRLEVQRPVRCVLRSAPIR